MVIQVKQAGEYKFEPTVKLEDQERKVESTLLHVIENKQDSKVAIPESDTKSSEENMKQEVNKTEKVLEENKKQELESKHAEVLKETKHLETEKGNEEQLPKKNELKEGKKINENNEGLSSIQSEKLLKGQSLLAASPITSVLKYPDVKVINNRTGEGSSIPGKYAFRFVWSPQVTYEVKGVAMIELVKVNTHLEIQIENSMY